MKLRCKKCGTAIAIPEAATTSPMARLTCPGCQTRYRMKRKSAAGASQSASPGVPRSSNVGGAGGVAVSSTRALTADERSGVAVGPGFSRGSILARRYRIRRFLARGGMGEVYEAEDLELGESVALKTISDTGALDVHARERFKREISLARKVTHPNVCRIFDLGQHRTEVDGNPTTFLTMELLAGETLAARLRRVGCLTAGQALPIARQVAAALEAAHQARVVHRDLKPENIFLVEHEGTTRAVVTDFGIARTETVDPDAPRLTGDHIVGTPAYMSPEQVEGREVTLRSDLYSFGIVLYEMVTGHLPFLGDSPLTTAAKRLSEAPRSPRVHAPDLDSRFESVILRLLDRRPEERFPSAAAAAVALVSDPADVQGSSDAVLVDRASSGGPPAVVPESGEGRPAAKLPAVGSKPSVPVSDAAVADAAPRSSVFSGLDTPPPSRQRSRLPLLLGVLALVSVLAGGLFFFNWSRRDDRLAPRRSVAVLGFENRGAQEEQAWLATALTEMLGSELGRGEVLRTVPGERVSWARQELDLDEVVELSSDELRRLYALLGSDFVVAGSYVAASSRLRIDLRLADAAVGKEMSSFAGQAGEDELFDLVARLGDDLRARLGVDTEGTEETLAGGLPSDREAARLYSEALDRLRASEPGAARDALVAAARIEPENALVHSALATAWSALGHGQRAAEAAERSFELSSDLGREDRLAIEGQYRETRREWGAAVGVYGSLWEHFPDSLDYGLRLVAAQVAAGRPGEAGAVLEALRRLPEPSGRDPRIDLAAAEVAALSADFEGQLAAASTAAARSRELGTALVEARARIAESQAQRFLGRPDAAARAARLALELTAEIDQPAGRAQALINLANAHFELAEFDPAEARLEDALEVFRRLGDQGGEASVLNNLALVKKRHGELLQAQDLYEKAQEIYESTGDRRGLANALNNRAALLLWRDELSAARGMFERSKRLWEEEGDANGSASALNNLAAVLRLEGRLAESREINEKALAAHREIGQRVGELYSLSNLGGVLAELGELSAAEKSLMEARLMAQEIGHRPGLAQSLYELAELRLWQGQIDVSAELHGEALAIREELDERPGVAESHLALARLELERRSPAAAEIAARHAASELGSGLRRAEESKVAAFLTLAFLGQKLESEARRAGADAARSKADLEQWTARFWTSIASARLEASRRRLEAAVAALRRLEEEASAAGYSGLALEARLERSILELSRSRGVAAAKPLIELQEEAAGKGYGGIRARAEAALTSL